MKRKEPVDYEKVNGNWERNKRIRLIRLPLQVMPLAVPPGAGKKTHEAPRLPQKAPDPAPALSECGSLAQVVSIVRLDKSTDEGASLAALLHFIFQLSTPILLFFFFSLLKSRAIKHTTKTAMEIIWDVDKGPINPLYQSPLKNSKTNLMIEYSIKYEINVFLPEIIFLLNKNKSRKKIIKLHPDSISCTGNLSTPEQPGTGEYFKSIPKVVSIP